MAASIPGIPARVNRRAFQVSMGRGKEFPALPITLAEECCPSSRRLETPAASSLPRMPGVDGSGSLTDPAPIQGSRAGAVLREGTAGDVASQRERVISLNEARILPRRYVRR